jgi:zinc and cadmium transporter
LGSLPPLMPPAWQVALYSVLIVLGAIAGAAVPLRAGGQRQTSFLAFAAGVMFGAAFFHMLPEAFRGGGYTAFTLVPAGFFTLFLLERYLLVHACEEPPDCAEHAHRAMGLTAFLGLSVHTLFDGVALGSATVEGVGFTAFLAIGAHKVPSSLALAAILRAEGRGPKSVLTYATLFGLMVPVGAGLYLLVEQLVHVERLAPHALAFSAGSFLYIAVSDLLPHVNRHGREGRNWHVAALLVGMAMMLALSALHPEP